MRREPYAVGSIFALSGAVMGNWVVRVPDAAQRTHASPGVLGLALLCVAGGAVVAMPLTGRLCARVDSRSVVTIAAIGNCVTLPPLAIPTTPLGLAAGLAAFGAMLGATDVSMNTNGVAAVRRAGRPLMPLFHGAFSAGGMIGAAAGGWAAATVAMAPHFAVAAGIGVVVALVARFGLPPDPPAAHRSATDRPQPVGRRLDATILILGLVAFCAAVGEGAVADWSALFMREVLGAGSALAAAGFTAFSVTMTAARFSGVAVLTRFSAPTTLIGGFALGAAGMLAVITAPAPAVALIGFAGVGAGVAWGFPLALNAAGAHASGAGPAIGVVTTIGYLGFIGGPPLIGFVTEWTSLRTGLGIVLVAAVAGLALAVGQRRLLREADPSREPAVTAVG